MAVAPPQPLPRSQFRPGYTRQEEWRWLITAAFFFGSVGAGLFLFAFALDFPEGAAAGLLTVAVLKTTAHLLFLGKPLRFWRAVVRWRSSWISRGVVAMGAFSIFAFVYLVPFIFSVNESAVTSAFGYAAAVCAFVVLVYDGFVMKASRGIPFWQSWLTPLLVLGYGALGGATLVLVLRAATGRELSRAAVDGVELGLVVVNLVLVGVYLFAAQARAAASAFAARMLTQGLPGLLFLALVVGVGLFGTLALGGAAAATGSDVALALAAVCDLSGHVAVFFAILSAGVYAPPRARLANVRQHPLPEQA